MSAVNEKWPDWGAGFRAPAVLLCADFLQASSLGSDLVVDDLVCLGGVPRSCFRRKVAFLQKIENKNNRKIRGCDFSFGNPKGDHEGTAENEK